MSLAGRSATRPSTLAPEDTGDAVWIAQRMVLDAGAQAARLRRLASVQAATICAAAERETDLIWQQASAQAAAIREAAEREAADLRATVMKLSAGPGELVTIDGVASQDVVRLVGKPGIRTAGKLATKPEAKPGIRTAGKLATKPEAKPGIRTAGKLATKPEAKPGIRTAGKPATKPETKPGTRRAAGPGPARRPQRPPRQLVAFRVAATATAALFLFAVASAGVEVATFGLKFFVFRTAVGESGPGVPTDQQFLAQEAASAHEAADKAAAAKTTAAKATAQMAQTSRRHSAKSTRHSEKSASG
jgi:hypothetical protein